MGEAIYPTPVIGVVGILDDVTKAIPSSFAAANQVIAILEPNEPSAFGQVESDEDAMRVFEAWTEASYRRFGSSDYVNSFFGTAWGLPSPVSVSGEAKLQKGLASLVGAGLITSAKDISDGGFAVALAQMAFHSGIGATASAGGPNPVLALFEEPASQVIVTFAEPDTQKVRTLAEFNGLWLNIKGETEGEHIIIGTISGIAVEASVKDLRTSHTIALKSQLAEEVLA